MTSKVLVLFLACLFVSCSTVATKRPELKTSKSSTMQKRPKGIAGMTPERPPEPAPTAILKEMPTSLPIIKKNWVVSAYRYL